ncbi:hypothetical protein HYQ46_013227 [Verticillium longisporum]|nr:hypothetical protein HYQ46_013227 [Verticillium longisporum]
MNQLGYSLRQGGRQILDPGLSVPHPQQAISYSKRLSFGFEIHRSTTHPNHPTSTNTPYRQNALHFGYLPRLRFPGCCPGAHHHHPLGPHRCPLGG